MTWYSFVIQEPGFRLTAKVDAPGAAEARCEIQRRLTQLGAAPGDEFRVEGPIKPPPILSSVRRAANRARLHPPPPVWEEPVPEQDFDR